MGLHAKPLKCLHAEQLSHIQTKNQQECDLLEDIRNFTKQRAAVEKTYAEALLKVSATYLHKKLPQLPELPSDGDTQNYNVFTVWRTLLEETEKLSKARLAAVEIFQQRIVDDAKTVRNKKVQTSKKCLEQLLNIQKELQGCVQELDNCKKRYTDEEHVAHEARDKANQAEDKMKKKKGFFTSFSSLQKNSAKLSAKKEQFEEKSTSARNAYLLQLSAAKSHQERYFNTDLQELLRMMEGDTYEKIADYLLLVGRTELFTCSASQASYTKLRDQSSTINAAYNIECYTTLYPSIAQNVSFEYDPCEGDTIDRVNIDKQCIAELEVQAQKWASRSIKDSKTLRESQKKLAELLDLKHRGERADPHDPTGTDIDIRIDEMRDNIRLSETSICKCQSRIQCLKDGGVNVDEVMKQMDINCLSVEDPLCRSSSQLSMREQYQEYDSDANDTSVSPTPAAIITSSYESERNVSADYDEDDREVGAVQSDVDQHVYGLGVSSDWGDVATTPVPPAPTLPGVVNVWSPESWDDPVSHHTAPCETPTATIHCYQPGKVVPGTQCYAIYSYEAQNVDELSIAENELLYIISDGDGDGWLRARNVENQQGLIPHNYIEMIAGDDPAVELGPHTATLDNTNSVEATGADDMCLQKTTSLSETAAPNCQLNGELYCRALYDYDATCDEELSLLEDDIVLVLRTVVHDGVDDGWWEGRVDGRVGLFPSLVVEECRPNGEPYTPDSEDSASMAVPPGFTPPEAPPHVLPGGESVRLSTTESVEEQSDSVFTDLPAAAPEITFPVPPAVINTASDDSMDSASMSCPTVVVVTSHQTGDDEVQREVEREQHGEQDQKTAELGFAQIVVTAPTPCSEHAPGEIRRASSEIEPDNAIAEEEFEGSRGSGEPRIVHTPATPPDSTSDDEKAEPLPSPPQDEQEQFPPPPWQDDPAATEETPQTEVFGTEQSAAVQDDCAINEQKAAPADLQEAAGQEVTRADSVPDHIEREEVTAAVGVVAVLHDDEMVDDEEQSLPEQLEPIHLVKLETMQESDT